MKYTKHILILVILVLFQSCLITNPSEENSNIVEIKVTQISEDGVKDLVFHNAEGDYYYINRGLENGFTLENARAAILNKNVKLHLSESWIGTESRHISQLEVDGHILYTEFEGELTVQLDH